MRLRITTALAWATFDCYGTLIDWNAGIRGQLERLFGVQEAPRLLERYHELEPEIDPSPSRSTRYREVLTLALERLAQEEQRPAPRGRGGRAREVAPGLAAVPRGAACARRAPRARLDARAPLQHRPRPDRRVAEAARRPGRPRDRGRGRRLLQARATGTGSASSRRRRRTARRTSTSRRASSTTSRRPASSACARSGSTASTSSPGPSRTAS